VEILNDVCYNKLHIRLCPTHPMRMLTVTSDWQTSLQNAYFMMC